MRFAIYRKGESEISHFLFAPEFLINDMTPQGFCFLLVGDDVKQETHIILDGEVALRQEV